LSAESAPPTGLALGSLGIPGLLDGDSQGADSPKKAGRLLHLKMRVAVRLHQQVSFHSFCHFMIHSFIKHVSSPDIRYIQALVTGVTQGISMVSWKDQRFAHLLAIDLYGGSNVDPYGAGTS